MTVAMAWLRRRFLTALAAFAALWAAPAGALDGRYTDANGDMVADAPTDPRQFVDPSTLIFAYTPVEDPEVYRKVWDDLAAVCHYRAVDLVGFGDSDKPDPTTVPYDPAWYGAQLEAFLDE